jgi:hypothetical protein
MNRYGQYGDEDDMQRDEDALAPARGIISALIFVGVIVALVIIAWPAAAQRGGEGNNTGCEGVGNPNSPCVPTTRPPTSGGAQVQAQRQWQAQAQTQTAQGGSATVTNNVTGGGTGGGTTTFRDQRQPPAVFVGSAIPPICGAGFSGGASNQNGTGVLGLSFETESCRKDRLAARLAALGRPDAGLALLCTMDEVRASLAATGAPCPGGVVDLPQPAATGMAAQQVIPLPPAPPARPRPSYCDRLPGIANSECAP